MFWTRSFHECSIYYICKKVGREKRIPFEVSVDPFYSESNIRYLENIVHDIKNGKANFAEHELIEVE